MKACQRTECPDLKKSVLLHMTHKITNYTRERRGDYLTFYLSLNINFTVLMQSKLYKPLSQSRTISTGKEHSSTFEILYIKTLIGLGASKTKSEGWEKLLAAFKAFNVSSYIYFPTDTM